MRTNQLQKRRDAALAGTIVLALLAAGCGSRESGLDTVAEAALRGGTLGGSGSGSGSASEGSGSSTGEGDISGSGNGGQTSTSGTASTGSDTGTGPGAGAGAGAGAGTGSSSRPGTGTGPGSPGAGGSTTAGGPKAPGKSYGNGKTDQGITDTTIKLGVIAPLTGAAGFLGEAEVAAIRAYTSMLNANGGIKGRQITLAIRDSQFRPDTEVQAARQLVDGDKVFALFGVLGDSTAPFLTQKKIPQVVFGVAPPAFSSKYPTTHVVGFSTLDAVVRMAYSLNVLQKKGIKSTAILYDTQNIDVTTMVKYMQKAWEATGAKVLSTDAFNVSDTDCTALTTKMQNLKIDFWQAGQGLAWPACLASMARARYTPPKGVGGPYSADSQFVGQGGSGANNSLGQMLGVQLIKNFGQPYPYEGGGANAVAPNAAAYRDSMRKYSPGSADDDTLESIWAQSFWVGAQAITRAIEAQTDGISHAGVNDWFHDQTSYKSGLISPINFDPNCKTGATMWSFQWKAGTTGRLSQSSWKDQGGPFSLPDDFINKVVPGGGQCYITKVADAEL